SVAPGSVVVVVVAVAAGGRLEQVDPVGDLLHRAVEAVAEPAREVDQTPRDLSIGPLQVHDDRLALLELVGDLLGLIEPARTDGCRFHVASCGGPGRALRSGLDARIVAVTAGLGRV